jgi:hypothetical protein
MKKEFMLYIRNNADAKKMLSADEHLAFVKKCEVYIAELTRNGNLVAAQPLVREGVNIVKTGGDWNIKDIDDNEGVQVGYYHLLAENMDEAIALTKNNPEFEYVPSASIEIRPIKMKEEKTGFVYPKER